jgi:hypothetical protein
MYPPYLEGISSIWKLRMAHAMVTRDLPIEQELLLVFRLHGVTAQETTSYIFVVSVTVSIKSV